MTYAAVVLCLSFAPAAAGDAHVAKLLAARDGLIAKLEALAKADAAIEPPTDFRLVLDEGADCEELDVTLRRRGGKWLAAEGVVPYWRQETQSEKFSFLHRDGGQSTTRDKFLWPVSAGGLKLTAGRLTGKMAIALRLNMLREERMVPGGRRLFAVDGRWSLMDQWRVMEHSRQRRQEYDVDARVLDGAWDFQLVLDGGIDGKAVRLHFRCPAAPWHPARATAPQWNAGVHEAEVSAVDLGKGTMSATIQVRLMPDPWWPRKVQRITYALSGTTAGGRFAGTFSAEVTGTEDVKVIGQNSSPDGTRPVRSGPTKWSGVVGGRALQAVEGRYRASGEMGEYVGAISGGVFVPSSDVRGMLGEDPPVDAPATERATRLYNQVRALRMAVDDYPYPPELALTKAEMPAPRWTGPDEEAAGLAASHVADLAAAVGAEEAAPAVARGRPRTGDPQFGPYYGSTPLDSGALPAGPGAAGPQRWQYVARWQVLGPLRQVCGADANTSDLPDLLPALGAGYALDPNAIGRNFRLPDDALLRWEPVESAAGRVDPPAWTWRQERIGKGRGAKVEVKRSDTPGRPDCVWYAAAEVSSPGEQQVWVGLDAVDRGKLWINGRLVWVDGEREWGWAAGGPAVVEVALNKGVNTLLVRCRDDCGGSRFSLWFCTQGGPVGGVPAGAHPE